MRRLIELERLWSGYQPFELPSRAGLLHAEGVRMHLGGIEKRYGRTPFGTVPDTDSVMALAVAQYPDGEGAFRLTENGIFEYNASNDTWEDKTASVGTISAETWAWDSMFQRFYLSPGYVFDTTANAGLIKQESLGGTLTAVDDSPGALFLAAYAGRLFAVGVRDSGGNLYRSRIQYSSPGNPDDWSTASGGGYVETIDDGHDPRAAFVMSGRLVVLRGSPTGGSVTFVTASQNLDFPLQYETVYGVGVFGKRAWCRIGSDVVMFLGHDNVYAMSGGQIRAVGDAVARKMLDILDPDRADEILAYYSFGNNDVVFMIPELGTTYLTRFTYNTITKAWTGPEQMFGDTSAALYHISDTRTWDDETALGDTWDDMEDSTWGDMTASSGVPVVLIGRSTGEVHRETETALSDDGSTIRVALETGDYDFENEQFLVPSGRYPARAAADDDKAVDGIYLTWKGTWTPQITISTDGGNTWTTVWSGELSGSDAAWSSRLIEFPPVVGKRFRVRITSLATDERFTLTRPLALQVDLAARVL